MSYNTTAISSLFLSNAVVRGGENNYYETAGPIDQIMIEGIFDIFFDFLTILKCKFKKIDFFGKSKFCKKSNLNCLDFIHLRQEAALVL